MGKEHQTSLGGRQETGHTRNVLTGSLLELEFPCSVSHSSVLLAQLPMFSLPLVVLYRSSFVLEASWHL